VLFNRFGNVIIRVFYALLPKKVREKVRSSIFLKILYFSIITIVLIGSITHIGAYRYNTIKSRKDLVSKCNSVADRVAHTIADPAWHYSRNQVITILDLEKNDKDIVGVVFSDMRKDFDGFTVGSVKNERFTAVDQSVWNDPARRPPIYHVTTRMVSRDGVVFGKVTVYVTDYFINRDIFFMIFMKTVSGILTVTLSVIIISVIFKTNIIRPAIDLNSVMHRFRKRDFNARAEIVDHDEIGSIAVNFNAMADTLEHYNASLENLVNERTIQLFQAEKMASLGEFVAGIVHDINTPVGICVTTISYLIDQTRKTLADYSAGSITPADLERRIAGHGNSLEIALKNLEKISALVLSFKKITSDRYIEEKRTFRVREYLDDIFTSLRPKFRGQNHTIDTRCVETLAIETFPGSFSQIIMNLTINSLTHAFDTEENGEIMIEALAKDHDFILTYSDNGKGILPDNIDHIFDPFFTTKRETGGTGLGLSIVQSAITQIMGGTITCVSSPGKGTSFTICIPGSIRSS
jgi:two-component system NtrC family sensor kinase